MPSTHVRARKGKPHCFSLDEDAHELLRVMAPNSKGIGLLLSELIRKEAEKRAARPALLERLAALHTGDDSVP